MNVLEALRVTVESIKSWTNAKIPTKTSQLKNDSKFVTIDDVNDNISTSEYSLVKSEGASNYAAVYNLTKDGVIVGASINIPKDMVVKSGSVVGDNIILVLNDEASTEIKIPVASLIEYVTSGSKAGDMVIIAVDETTHKVTATITDGAITTAKLTTELQTAISKTHSHENSDVLASINANKVAAWDATEDTLKTYTDDAVAQKSQVQIITSDNTESLSTLQIHKLTKEEYDEKVATGDIDENALYLTPDEEMDLSNYATLKHVESKIDEVKAYTDDIIAKQTQVQIITWEADD